MDKAGDYLNGIRGELGAAQNHFESRIDSLSDQNLSAVSSRGRIQDADYAPETAEQARNMIPRQSSIAMPSQANASSARVLTLLDGGSRGLPPAHWLVAMPTGY